MVLFSTPKGTRDIEGDEVYIRREVADTILRVLETYGYRQVLTPAFEEIDVLKAKAGEGIIEQIYDFYDKGERHLGLRSDITASVGRLIAPQTNTRPKPIKISAYDRVWRYEKPQTGRYREFFQINAELFGTDEPISDAETLACFCDSYDSVGLTNYKMHFGHRRLLEDFVKTLDVPEEKLLAVVRAIDKAPKLSEEQFRNEVLKSGLPEKSIEQLETFTAMRGPIIPTFESAISFLGDISSLKSSLEELGRIIDFIVVYGIEEKCLLDLSIARGSDYYTGIIFECIYDTSSMEGMGALGGTIGGGGRYDNLIEIYGGVPTPAVGFSIGFERVMNLLLNGVGNPISSLIPALDCYVIAVDETCQTETIQITQLLRKNDFIVEIDLMGRNVKSLLSQASKLKAKYAILVGPDELSEGKVVVRNMDTREEKTVQRDALIGQIEKVEK